MGDEAVVIRNHLSLCGSCQTELSAISQFESRFLATVGALGQTSAAPPQANPAGLSFLDDLRERFDSWAGGWAIAGPALAVAIIILFGMWTNGALDRFRAQSLPPDSAPQLVRESPPEHSGKVPMTPEPKGPGTPKQLAIGSASYEGSTSPSPQPAIEGRRIPRNGPTDLAPKLFAQAEPLDKTPTPEVPPVRDAPGPDESAAREAILLAALSKLPLPDYAAPPQPGSVGWMRQFSAVRSGASTARIETRAPRKHAGLALALAPRLWWNLPRSTDLNVQVTVIDDRKIDPIARFEISGPAAAGLHTIDLAEHDVSLEPGIEYRWFVSLLVDPDRPSRNPVAAGALRVLNTDDPRRTEASAASPSERGHTLAKLGVWYDAYDFFATISESHPEVSALTRHREHLAMTAGAGADN